MIHRVSQCERYIYRTNHFAMYEQCLCYAMLSLYTHTHTILYLYKFIAYHIHIPAVHL